VFWQRVLHRFDTTFTPDDLASGPGKSYRFERLKGTDEEIPRLRALLPEIKERSRAVSPEAFELNKGEWEHLRALQFLRAEHLTDEYLAFLEPLSIKSTLSTARHWYYARQLAGLGAHGDFLEIGAGGGNLAYFLHLMGVVRSYTIVDLPAMLLHSASTVEQCIGEQASMADVTLSGRFNFIPDILSNELADNRFDVAVNINSFMEMDRDARDGYIALVYRVCRPGALFFNVNRRQPELPLHDGGSWDNNPLLYPYRADDEVLIWEEDPFQTATRTVFGSRAHLAVTRAARIR
jgi:SAM-dependent methyltransferase